MRDTGTSSAQTAGCGHTEIQQGLLVKQDFPLQRVAGETAGLLVPEWCRFPSVAGSGVYQLQIQC